jgi:hypothetical protein
MVSMEQSEEMLLLPAGYDGYHENKAMPEHFFQSVAEPA